MTDRTHFVYRAWDEFGSLLYIGCTKQPTIRWKQHVADRRTWTQYAQRFTMQGPFHRSVALAKEREAITTEDPYFNARPDEVGLSTRRHAEKQRLVNRIKADRPEFTGLVYDTPLWDEFSAALEGIDAQLDRTHPVVTDDERHAHYLNDLRRKRVRSA